MRLGPFRFYRTDTRRYGLAYNAAGHLYVSLSDTAWERLGVAWRFFAQLTPWDAIGAGLVWTFWLVLALMALGVLS